MRLILFILFLTIPLGIEAQEETISIDPFGQIHVYQPASKPPVSVLILISGDGGWEHAVLKMAKVLSGEGCLVAGVDINQYLKNLEKRPEDCASPATDFQTLGQSVQEKYGIKKVTRPYLVGYSSGATLVYAAIVQAQPSIFAAAFSFGFCPDFSVKKPFCKGKDLEWDEGRKKTSILFRPTKNLQIPWIVFQGYVDQVCNEDVTREFVQQVPNAEFVLLPKVGHGFNVLKNWLPKFQEIFSTIEKQ
jgi:type IV secretory pathway VirJ component